MVIASWNGITWECSPSLITYLDALTTSFSIETQSNADKDGKSPTETVGVSPIEVSFSTTYRVETGTADIMAIINLWKSMIGLSAPLIIGDTVFGAENMQLQSISVSDINLHYNGFVSAATLSFKFKEYTEKKKTDKKSSSKSSKKSKLNTSAANLGPTKKDKESKKTVQVVKGGNNKYSRMQTK